MLAFANDMFLVVPKPPAARHPLRPREQEAAITLVRGEDSPQSSFGHVFFAPFLEVSLADISTSISEPTTNPLVEGFFSITSI